jgi:hypothetical protein
MADPVIPRFAPHHLGGSAGVALFVVAIALLPGQIALRPESTQAYRSGLATFARALLDSEGTLLGSLLAANLAIVALVVSQSTTPSTAEAFSRLRNVLGLASQVIGGMAGGTAAIVALGCWAESALLTRLFAYSLVASLVFAVGVFGAVFVFAPAWRRAEQARLNLEALISLGTRLRGTSRPLHRAAAACGMTFLISATLAAAALVPLVVSTELTRGAVGAMLSVYGLLLILPIGLNIVLSISTVGTTSRWERRVAGVLGCSVSAVLIIACWSSFAGLTSPQVSLTAWIVLPTVSAWLPRSWAGGSWSLHEAAAQLAAGTLRGRRLRAEAALSALPDMSDEELVSVLEARITAPRRAAPSR